MVIYHPAGFWWRASSLFFLDLQILAWGDYKKAATCPRRMNALQKSPCREPVGRFAYVCGQNKGSRSQPDEHGILTSATRIEL